MQILAIISTSVVLHTSHHLCPFVESGWWQAPEDTAEASSQTGDKHGELFLPLLYVQHKWWNLRQINYSVKIRITVQIKKYWITCLSDRSYWSLVSLSCHSAEALNQGDTVDLDALMADLCCIEQELNTISKPNSTSRSHNKGQQRAPGGHSASTKHTGTSGGGGSGGTE